IGSFSLHDWTTTGAIQERYPDLPFSPPDPSKAFRCLGVEWDPNRDEIIVQTVAETLDSPTRRQAASFLARLYDPLDLTLPFKVKVRDLARRISLTAISWDAHLPIDLAREFQELAQQYKELRVQVPRGVASAI